MVVPRFHQAGGAQDRYAAHHAYPAVQGLEGYPLAVDGLKADQRSFLPAGGAGRCYGVDDAVHGRVADGRRPFPVSGRVVVPPTDARADVQRNLVLESDEHGPELDAGGYVAGVVPGILEAAGDAVARRHIHGSDDPAGKPDVHTVQFAAFRRYYGGLACGRRRRAGGEPPPEDGSVGGEDGQSALYQRELRSVPAKRYPSIGIFELGGGIDHRISSSLRTW